MTDDKTSRSALLRKWEAESLELQREIIIERLTAEHKECRLRCDTIEKEIRNLLGTEVV